MLDFIIAVICLVLATVSMVYIKAFFGIPIYELKRRAVNRDAYARAIYPVAVYGPVLEALLWLVIVLAGGISLVLFNKLAPAWLGIGLLAAWLWLSYAWLGEIAHSNFGRRLSQVSAVFFVWALAWLYKPGRVLAGVMRSGKIKHTGIYESEDLQALLLLQENQADNRLSATQIGRLHKLLVFESAKVSHYMIEWKNIMTVHADEPIGPKLLDDMHKSAQTVFPVYGVKSSAVLLGTLNKDDVGLKTEGRVADYMRTPVRYLNKDESMENALAKFALSGQALCVVVSKDHKPIGVLTLKDALGSILTPQSKTNPRSSSNDNSETESTITEMNIEGDEEDANT